MTTNESFVHKLFGDIAEEGFGKKFLDALAPDLVWVVTGSSHLAGEYRTMSETTYSPASPSQGRRRYPYAPALDNASRTLFRVLAADRKTYGAIQSLVEPERLFTAKTRSQ